MLSVTPVIELGSHIALRLNPESVLAGEDTPLQVVMTFLTSTKTTVPTTTAPTPAATPAISPLEGPMFVVWQRC
jgi:hypothetical protein